MIPLLGDFSEYRRNGLNGISCRNKKLIKWDKIPCSGEDLTPKEIHSKVGGGL